jgi:hypothetical protein
MHRKLYAGYSKPQLDLGPIGSKLERRPVPSLRRPGFEDEDDDEYENEVPHENARKRSWKRTWAASAADITKAATSPDRSGSANDQRVNTTDFQDVAVCLPTHFAF